MQRIHHPFGGTKSLKLCLPRREVWRKRWFFGSKVSARQRVSHYAGVDEEREGTRRDICVESTRDQTSDAGASHANVELNHENLRDQGVDN